MASFRARRWSRRRFLLTAATAAGGGAVLLACGPEAAPATSSPATSSPTAGAASPTPAPSAFPVSITHRLGTTQIARAPQRVVALSAVDLDSVVALGIVPVGATKDLYHPSGVSSWLQGRVDPSKTAQLPSGAEVPLEQITALQPDLVVATGFQGLSNAYEHLSKIAPVLGYQTVPAGETWQERVQVTARALGRAEQASQAIAAAERAIADTRQKHPALAGKTFSLSLAFAPGQIATIYNPQDFAVRYFEALGLKPAPALASLQPFSATNTSGAVSLERVGMLDADLVVMAYGNPDLRTALEGNALFTSMPAVRQGRYFVVDMETIAALRFPTALNIPWTLERLAPAFSSIR